MQKQQISRWPAHLLIMTTDYSDRLCPQVSGVATKEETYSEDDTSCIVSQTQQGGLAIACVCVPLQG